MTDAVNLSDLFVQRFRVVNPIWWHTDAGGCFLYSIKHRINLKQNTWPSLNSSILNFTPVCDVIENEG